MSQTGRVDILFLGLMNEYAKRQANPLVEAAVNHFQPAIRETLENTVGPRTDIGRKAKRAVQNAQEFHQQLNQAKQRRGLR